MFHQQQSKICKSDNNTSDTISQRRRPRNRRDNLNTITRILSNTACYTSATCCAFIIGAYHPHRFRPVEGSETECSGMTCNSTGQLERLLRHLQTGVGKDINEMDVTNSRIWTFMSGISAWLKGPEVSQTLSDPPPLFFLAALLIYSLAISSLWRSQRKHGCRSFCVGIVMTSGVLCAMYTGNWKGTLAWYTIIALACSSVMNWMVVEGEGEGYVQVDEKVMIRKGRIEEQSGQEMLHEKTGATAL